MTPRLRVACLALLATLLAPLGTATAGSLETLVDNDTNAFVPGPGTTDRYYSQGARFTWFADAGAMPRWADRLAARVGGPDETRRFGFALGQEIYTPDAISTAKPCRA